ncbi:hypothetical protein HK098_000078 [Nowakowskiella sp. JEL0407]|nr:hypothetical protein HK098_000078 [Nowakowskiella sp. JEL0407]
MQDACKVGVLSVVTTLLSFGANPFFPNERRQTPFSIACTNGHLSVVKLIINGESEKTVMLIRKDAKVKPKLVDPTPPPREAINITESINIPDRNENTALILASNCDCKNDILEYLISFGAKFNHQNKNGNTALHKALKSEAYRNVVSLLRCGQVDLDIMNNRGKNAETCGRF